MKNIYLAILSLVISLPSMAFEVVKLPLPKSDKIVVRLMFRNGSISDPAGMEGLTAMTSAMITEGGTKKLTSSQIKEITYPWASRWGSSVDKEVSIISFEFHKDHADLFFPILTGLILQPSFSEEDFKRVKSNQQNFVNEVIRASSDEDYSKMALEALLFRGTPYEHMVNGTTKGVEKITLQDVINHYKKFYTKDNLMLGIAGSYSDAFLSKLSSELNNLPALTVKLPAPVPARTPDGLQIEIISKANALGSAVFTGFPLPVNRKDDSYAAFMIANSWLGEHRKSYSRLYKKIREERSMNYGDYSYIEWYDNGGQNMLLPAGTPRTSNYFSIWLRPVQTAESLKKQYAELENIKTGHAHFALRMALREMQNLIDNGLSAEDFELTRQFLRSYIKLYIQTPSRQLGYLMDSRFYGRKDYIAEMDKLLEKVTLDEVNTAVKKMWQTQNMFIAIITDDSEAAPLKESLLNNNPSPMSYSNALKATLPEELLKEDELVSTFPLKVKKVDIIDSENMFRE
jgi:zinc protease